MWIINTLLTLIVLYAIGRLAAWGFLKVFYKEDK